MRKIYCISINTHEPTSVNTCEPSSFVLTTHIIDITCYYMVQQIENIPFIQLEAGSVPVKNSVEEVGKMQSSSTLHWWKFFSNHIGGT